jgi:hypothetical protein
MEDINRTTFCLNPHYSTTRRVSNITPVVEDLADAKFASRLLVPPQTCRQGEGGLRTQGYFKVRESQSSIARDNTPAGGRPLITVITAVYNGAKTLERCLRSVISQNYDNIEYIIIDGGSTDGTLDIIRQYEPAIDYWLSEPDRGIYDAWNKGVQVAMGDWVAFLGADDMYLPGAIHSYMETIAAWPDRRLEFISSRVNLTHGTEVVRTIGKQWRWKSFRRYMSVAHVGSLHRLSLFQKYGLFDISYKISGDYEFLLRPKSGLRTAFLNSITVNMGIAGVSNKELLVFQEKERAQVTTGGRSVGLSRIEKIVALTKWRLRRWLWY